MARKATIKLRQDTYENFEADASGDGILQGEVVYLTDKKALVVGDGVNGVAGHPTLIPVGNYHNTEVDGWTVTKDNNDIERKFWKDDFSVDSSSQYTGDVASYTGWGTGEITTTGGVKIASTDEFGDGVYSVVLKITSSAYALRYAFMRICCEGSRGGYYVGFYLNQGIVSLVQIFKYSPEYTVVGSVPASIVIDQYYRVDLIKIGSSLALYVDGVLKISATDTDYNSGNIGVYNANADAVFSELTYAPSISYSDDFTADTVTGANGRYQAVTGTVVYDDTNKRMNVVTASGANGKASGRLKSYKFCEGSQIYDVLLPTGADGDFICMVTHATSGAMDNGIGVGLQSDGAGNWNLATLSGTTVTEGADSGLNDADVARIEIEKDLSGAYWYYIYDASGAKPTTATGKLFTTLTEGYTGWYTNGAGAETQTYAIDNISIRAESIVGRTNVEVTEDVFNSVTGEIESRTYFKPIHRGAMLETYHDGTQEVVGTTFIDDCQWDRLDEYQTAPNSATSFTWDSADAVYVCDHTSGSGLVLPIAFTDGYVSFKIKRSFIAGIVLRSDGVINPNATHQPLNGININRESHCGVYVNGTKVVELTGVPLSVTDYVYVEVLVVGTFLAYWADGVKIYSGTVPEIATGYDKIMIISYGNGSEGFGHNKTHIKDLVVIATSSDATNGIAACIPPIGGGARYGVQEGASIEFTNKALRGDYDFTTCVKTTVPGAISHNEMYFGNTTDTSAITEDMTSTKDLLIESASYLDFEKPLVLNYDDRKDTITVGVRKHTDNDPTTYIDFMAVVPTKEVI